jgi:hypothetical protein
LKKRLWRDDFVAGDKGFFDAGCQVRFAGDDPKNPPKKAVNIGPQKRQFATEQLLSDAVCPPCQVAGFLKQPYDFFLWPAARIQCRR